MTAVSETLSDGSDARAGVSCRENMSTCLLRLKRLEKAANISHGAVFWSSLAHAQAAKRAHGGA